MENKKKIKILKKIRNKELSGIENIESPDFITFLDFCIENDFVGGIRYENGKYLKIFIKNMILTPAGEAYLKELKSDNTEN
ncbi:MAG: hypothetical protein ACRCVS_01650 [Fusobacteriaceae bacterium]